MAVRFADAATPIAGAPVALFTVPPELRSYAIDGYTPLDAAADGRSLMARRVGATGANSYPIVTENFLTVLRERVGRQDPHSAQGRVTSGADPRLLRSTSARGSTT
jgi:hypothetical protein